MVGFLAAAVELDSLTRLVWPVSWPTSAAALSVGIVRRRGTAGRRDLPDDLVAVL